MIRLALVAVLIGQTIEHEPQYHEDDLIVIRYEPNPDVAKSAVFWNVIDERVRYEQVVSDDGSQVLFAAAPPGEYQIFANVLNEMESGAWVPRTKQIRFAVTPRAPPGPGPTPPEPGPGPVPPEPTPNVPEDQFDNLGRLVAANCKNIQQRAEVATVYKQAAARLTTIDPNTTMTIDESARFIKDELASLYQRYPDLANSLAALRAKIAPVWTKHVTRASTKFTVAAFYTAIAAGLGA